MKSPKDIRIADFSYELPDERIAKYPLAERDASKLLIYNHGSISHRHFRDVSELLPEGSLMVMNNTRVIQARMHFRKETGALIEVFCLEPARPNDYVLMFQQTAACTWHCLVGNSKKWKSGVLSRAITVDGRQVVLTAERSLDTDLAAKAGEQLIRFSWTDTSITWAQVIDACGELPIPPYLNRKTEESDLRTYQTVYSKVKGSVAAPTAGLHFTPAVLNAIDQRGIERAELTLHVGAGTFKPKAVTPTGKLRSPTIRTIPNPVPSLGTNSPPTSLRRFPASTVTNATNSSAKQLTGLPNTTGRFCCCDTLTAWAMPSVLRYWVLPPKPHPSGTSEPWNTSKRNWRNCRASSNGYRLIWETMRR